MGHSGNYRAGRSAGAARSSRATARSHKMAGLQHARGPGRRAHLDVPATSAAYPWMACSRWSAASLTLSMSGILLFRPSRSNASSAAIPGLIDVAVVGMAQAGGQQEIWIGVMAQGQVNEQAIEDFLLKKNPRWKVSRVKVLDRIRRNDMGKIVRARIREKLLAQ